MLIRLAIIGAIALIIVVGVIAHHRSTGKARELTEERRKRIAAEQETRLARQCLNSVETDLRTIANGFAGNPAMTAQSALDTISTYDSTKELNQ